MRLHFPFLLACLAAALLAGSLAVAQDRAPAPVPREAFEVLLTPAQVAAIQWAHPGTTTAGVLQREADLFADNFVQAHCRAKVAAAGIRLDRLTQAEVDVLTGTARAR